MEVKLKLNEIKALGPWSLDTLVRGWTRLGNRGEGAREVA